MTTRADEVPHGDTSGSFSNCMRTSGRARARLGVRGNSISGGVHVPLPSASIQIGFVIAYGVAGCCVFGFKLDVIGNALRSSPAETAVMITVASSGGNSTGELTG